MNMNKKDIRILVVDDEEDLRHVIAINLELDGYIVYQGASANEGLTILKENKIDFVISDIRMPGTDGVKFLEAIRKDHPEMPIVILISGYCDITKEEAMQKGAIDLLDKPVDMEIIEKMIAQHVKH